MMLAAIVAGVALAILGVALGAGVTRRTDESLVERIDALLPQTQCEQCSYPGCRPYAEAIARGDAHINRCPPGGQDTVDALARLLNRDTLPLAASPAIPGPAPVALIDEDLCIGCALCIKACPVDAILGAAKRMHTVIDSECTGCELCIAPCPVDCISLEPRPAHARLPHVTECA